MTAKRACSKCGLKRQQSSYTGPRGRVCSVCRRSTRKRSGRASHLRTTYDISPEEYEALLVSQDGRCAICRQVRRYLLHVEHCHKTERTHGVRASVRGLACRRCNKVLRDAGDNPALLEAAAAYLRDWPARKVLDDVGAV